MYIELAKHELLKVSPYFGHLLQTIDIEETNVFPDKLRHFLDKNPAIEEAGCLVYGNGDRWTVLFREDIVCYWHPEQRVGALAHELMHLVIDGHARSAGKQPMLWNIAQDMVINTMLSDTGFCLPDEAIFPKHADFSDGQTAESYYDQLERNGKPKGVPDGFDGGVHGEVDSQAKRRLDKAAAKFAKEAGKKPGFESLAVDLPDETEPLPKAADWRDVLYDAVRSCLTIERGSSFAKFGNMSARQGGVGYGHGCPRIPSWYKRRYDVVVAIDTSGSMFGELSQLRAEVEAICQSASGGEIRLMQCDAGVAADGKHRLGQKIEMKGGGSTSFVPVFETLEREGTNPDLLVYVTDGYGEFPDSPPRYQVVWGAVGSVSDGSFPFGRVVRCGGSVGGQS